MTSPIIGLFVLFFASLACHAQTLSISNAHYPMQAEQYLVVLDTTAAPTHRRVFVENNPPRLIIDIYNSSLNTTLPQPPQLHPLFAKLKVIHKNNTDLRLVINLKKLVTNKHFSLTTDNHNPQQLVVRLKERIADVSLAKPADSSLQVNSTPQKPAEPKPTVKKHQPVMVAPEKTTIVAIDAGHGGSDPGAHGALGTDEKMITFAIAQKLAQLINKAPHMKAVMVRKSDDFIELEQRTQSAREANASLFVSIHADAYPDPNISGASVFTFSKKGASSKEAQWLANSENAAYTKAGENIENDIDWVIEDLKQNTSVMLNQQDSIDLAKAILKNIHKICGLHRTEVQNAGFQVLKSAGMPSVLVETAFISNPKEEKKLLSNNYQNQIAQAIFKGIQAVFGQ